jgi:putative hydrolase of HD superfamily
VIDTLVEVARLKEVHRAGWARKGITAPESVAAHSWGMCWLVLLLAPEELNRERALSYAVLHDLPEVRVGDITPYDQVSAADKHQREHEAMEGLCASLPEGERIRLLWEEYEAQVTPEAKFVRQLDRLDMAIQAVAYAEAGHSGLEEFLDSAATVIDQPRLCALLQQLRQKLEGLGTGDA